MILPNVVIAGAPKCGTTSIFEWLSVRLNAAFVLLSVNNIAFFINTAFMIRG